MVECLACGRPALVEVAAYDTAVVSESDDADYCVVTESVEGRHVFVHGRDE